MRGLMLFFRQYKKVLAGTIFFILAGSVGVSYYRQNKQLIEPVKTITVERGNIQATVSATGTISAVNSVDISSRVTGLITEVKVKENDIVTEGQELVVLDNTSLKDQLAQYQAQLQNYASSYKRSKKLADIGAISVQQLDADRTNYEVAQSNFNSYTTQLDYYIIKSPINGVVIGKPTPAGQTVAQGISSPQVIMTIADLSKMQIKVLVDESDIGKVKQGQVVQFTVDAYQDKTFTGVVSVISKSAAIQSNVVYYSVYVNVDSTEGLLYPSMTARVTIDVDHSNNTLIIPLTAVKDNKGKKYVQKMANGKAENTFIKTGLVSDDKVEIIEGLNEGDLLYFPVVTQKQTSAQHPGPPPF